MHVRIAVVALAFMAAVLMLASAAQVSAATPHAAAPAAPPAKAARPAPQRRPAGMTGSARQYYAMTWGVDGLSAKLAESGRLVRFNYRVIDAAKAAPLNEKSSSPLMIDDKSHVALPVPTMEQVGPFRQSITPENGKTYWMVFSNKGSYVKAGHRVSVVIGQVRIDGVIVQN